MAEIQLDATELESLLLAIRPHVLSAPELSVTVRQELADRIDRILDDIEDTEKRGLRE
jgi:hypothetical protein